MRHVTHRPIVLETLLARVADPSRGGTASFLGTVRSGGEDGAVTRIEYSAYETMLEEEAARIVAEATSRWPGAGVALQHRLGPVLPGEASIAVVAAAPHRAEAFAAARWVIEEAKRRLPVWKQEHLADGTVRWPANEPARVPDER